MYKVFDSFLATDTWHTSHQNDEERFYRTLHKVVTDPAFNPDKMGEYMRAKKPDPKGGPSPFESQIQDLVHQAWAVRDYLAANGLDG